MERGTETPYPLFDAHMHFSQAYLEAGLASFETYGIGGGINLWGGAFLHGHGFSCDFREFLEIRRRRGLERFAAFYWPPWSEFGWRPEAFVRRLCDDMRRYAALGATGLKVWKDLGMFILHADGTPATMDETALECVWATAAELGWTIAVHQADPSRAFARPTRAGLSREELFERRNRVLSAHPEIRFILCHNGNDVESVAGWAALLEAQPHCLADMNRDPCRHDTVEDVRDFLERYADRILWGTDLGMPQDRPGDDAWCMEHIFNPWRSRLASWGLSDEALHKITWGNGERYFLPG